MGEKQQNRYTDEHLNSKSKQELIQIIKLMQEEVDMLDFLLREYEASQSALGSAFEEKLSDLMMNSGLYITDKIGDA